MPLDAPLNDPDLVDLRRRAGLGQTPTYRGLNPDPIMVPMSEADLNAIIAALELIQQSKEMVPSRQLVDRLKRFVGRKTQSYQHDPLSPDNPFRQEAMLKSG